MKKQNAMRIIAMLLLAVLLVSAMPLQAAAEEIGGSCSQTVKWKLDTATGRLTIYGSGDMPGFSYHNQPYADYKGQIKHIVVEPGITSVGGYAFTYCDNVETVTLPDGITSIGDFAFADHNITEINIPASVQSIGGYAFSGCGYLQKVNLPQGLTKISSNLFNGCGALKRIDIPASVTTVGYCAFSGCGSLKEVHIKDLEAWCRILFDESDGSPSNPLRYAGKLYLNGELVTEVVVPEGITSLDETFANCSSLKRVVLPESLTVIGGSAFKNCRNLREIVIGSEVTKIGYSAFFNCHNLKIVYYTGTQEQWNAISIGDSNYPLLDAEFRLGFDGSFEGREEVNRLYGSHRWETAIRVADAMKENLGVEKFDAIIIASGNDFADALAGSYLATAKNAPILLGWGKGGSYAYLDNNNIDYVKANLAEGGTVYILGGKNAVPELYENALQGCNVKRLGGANRFETNLQILQEAGIQPGKDILVCTSTNFADSLSASATGLPILLVWNEGGKLFDNQKEFLAGLNGGNKFCIVGGESAVSTTLMRAIGTYGTTSRLAGNNRFETSVMVAQVYFDSPESVVLAYAWNYPDGLCGGALAHTMDAPLILTMTKYEDQAEAYIFDHVIQDGMVLGGEGLIAETSVQDIFDMKP